MKVSISTLSTAYGLTPEALRYYEEKGLLSPERSGASGFRRFSIADVQMLGIIKSLQRQGFSLDEIRQVVHTGCSLEELIGMMDEKRTQLSDQAAFALAMCGRVTACTDLLRDCERLLMHPRICQGAAAYLLDFDSVAQLWESVPKMPILKNLIDALPLSSYCTVVPLAHLQDSSIRTRTGVCVPAEYATFIRADFSQMRMSAGPRCVRMLFDLRPPQHAAMAPAIDAMKSFLRNHSLTPVSDGYTRQYSWHVDENGSQRQFSELIIPVM